MKELISSHRKGFLIFTCIFLIFIGCFAFPIVNFSPDAPQISRWLNLAVAFFAYYEIGLLLGALYDGKEQWKGCGLSLLMTVIGFASRYLLEFGEVSNSYNFIPSNIIVHLLAAVCVSGLSAAVTREKN